MSVAGSKTTLKIEIRYIDHRRHGDVVELLPSQIVYIPVLRF